MKDGLQGTRREATMTTAAPAVFSVYVGRRSRYIYRYQATAQATHTLCVCLIDIVCVCVCARVHEDVCSKQCFGSN